MSLRLHALLAALALMLAPVALWTGLGYFVRRRLVPVTVAALYWHFVDVVWLTIFFTFYVMPRLG